MILRQKISAPIEDSFLKVVADIERRILSYGCDLHVDCAEELLEDGSQSEYLWGANVYPEEKEIEFISLINVRPAQGNRSMKIEKPEVQQSVESVIRDLLLPS